MPERAVRASSNGMIRNASLPLRPAPPATRVLPRFIIRIGRPRPTGKRCEPARPRMEHCWLACPRRPSLWNSSFVSPRVPRSPGSLAFLVGHSLDRFLYLVGFATARRRTMSPSPTDATQQNPATLAHAGEISNNPFGLGVRRTLAIARNAFREAVRDRVLYNLVLFVLLLTGGAIFLGELSAGQETKIIIDLGLSAMLLFGVFIAIFVGVGLVYKEIERRTLNAILSKPIGRGQFLLGKYLGLCLTLAVNVLIMGVGVSLALIFIRRGWDPLALRIWPAILLIYVELTIMTAVALVFSSFSSPALSALMSFFVFIIGHFSTDLSRLGESAASAPARWLFRALYYLLPNFSIFSAITTTGHGMHPDPQAVGGALVYGALYVVVLLSAAALIFRRRNFK